MPWSKKNVPRPAKNWSPAAQAVCIRVANGVLNNGGSDTDAIRACIGAVKRAHPDQIKAPKKDWKGRKHDDVSALAFTAGFYALPRIDLKEGTNGRYVSTLQVLPEGRFKHPWYGDLDFTASVLRATVRHFDQGILGTDIMVDEGHDRGRALGWFRSLRHKQDQEIGGSKFSGLFADIEWTAEGRSLLERDIYRYFSAEIGSYTGPDGKKIANVLFGGGLTNRPFFKQMPRVQFGEGAADDRFVIGLFDDELWAFNDVEKVEEDEEEERTFFRGFSTDEDEDTEDDDESTEEEDDSDDNEEEDMKYADLLAKLNKDFGLTLSADNETEAAAAIEHAFSSNATLAAARKKFTDAGFKLDENSDLADVVLASYNALRTANTENTAAIAAIRKELDDTKAAAAVDSLISEGKVVPAKRDQYIKLFNTNHELFDEMTKDMEPVVQFGEIGGDGVPAEPGAAKEGEFKDPAKAKDEAERYLHMVPIIEERLPAGKK